jgi:hypothetical protein
MTGGDTLEQLIGSALVDGQIVQLIEEENETTIAIVTRVSADSIIVHASEEKKGGRVWIQVLSAPANDRRCGRGDLVEYVQQAYGTDASQQEPPSSRNGRRRTGQALPAALSKREPDGSSPVNGLLGNKTKNETAIEAAIRTRHPNRWWPRWLSPDDQNRL